MADDGVFLLRFYSHCIATFKNYIVLIVYLRSFLLRWTRISVFVYKNLGLSSNAHELFYKQIVKILCLTLSRGTLRQCGEQVGKSLRKARNEISPTRAGGRAVDLGGPSVYQGGPKFKIKHKSRCPKRISLLIGGA